MHGKVSYEIYGTSGCEYCSKARWLLDYHNIPYTYIDVMESADIQAAFFKKFPNTNKVPQVMFDGRDRGYPVHIGGYDELERWMKELTQRDIPFT